MDQNMDFVQQKRLERVQAALSKNNMQAHIVQKAADVVPMLQDMLPPGATIANGGSMTLRETGVLDFLRGGEYEFWDREAPGADIPQIFRDAFHADFYFTSANAITEQGQVYEIDGNGNRIAAIAYGPKKVVIIAGINKIVADLDAARQRRREIASPANARRVGAKTPCTVTGVCNDCSSPGRICCTELILHQQRIKDRIVVILVNECLGY